MKSILIKFLVLTCLVFLPSLGYLALEGVDFSSISLLGQSSSSRPVMNVIDKSTGKTVTGVLRGKVVLEAKVSNAKTDSVVFNLTGPIEPLEQKERSAPFYFMGKNSSGPIGWNTAEYPNGDYTLRAYAYKNNRLVVNKGFSFSVENNPIYNPDPIPSTIRLSLPSDMPTTYIQGSGVAVPFSLNGDALPPGNDILVLAWSDATGSMIDSFAHSLTQAPWEVSNAKLDALPLGDTTLVFMLRLQNQKQQVLNHKLSIQPEPKQKAITIAIPSTAPTSYTQNSGAAVGFEVSKDLPSGADVLALVWSDEKRAMVDAFAHSVTESPWNINNSKLDALPAGNYVLVLILRVPGQEEQTVNHKISILPKPAPTAVTVSLPSNMPTSYTEGSGAAVTFNLNGQLAAGDDVLALAWSNSLGAMVDSFAHSITKEPWQISNEKLDALPAGDIPLILLLRQSGVTKQNLNHKMSIVSKTVSTPTPTPPTGNLGTVYVSSSTGNDNNDGLSPSTPVKSISKGISLIRDGMPDKLLFKAGDVWSGGFGTWNKSGKSAAEPMIIGSYGSGARPLFRVNGLHFIYGGNDVEHVKFTGLDVYNNHGDPKSSSYTGSTATNRGVFWLTPFKNLTFENMHFEYMGSAFVIESPDHYTQDGITIKKNVVKNSYGGGVFIAFAKNVTITESLLDHNGWIEKPDGSIASKTSVFNHNAYMHSNKNLVFSGNISARASNFGLKVRSDETGAADGVVITDNLFVGNTGAISVGGNKKDGIYQPYSTKNLVIARNAFTKMGGTLANADSHSFGAGVNTVENGVIEDNVFFDKPSTYPSFAIKIDSWKAPSKNLTIRRNISHNWVNGTISGSKEGIASTDNSVDLAASSYTDATRTIESYQQSLGRTPSLKAFLDDAAKQLSSHEAGAVVNYFRSGYKLK